MKFLLSLSFLGLAFGEECFDFQGENDTAIDGSLDSWTVINLKSNRTWEYDTYGDNNGAFNNNYDSAEGGLLGGIDADDYLIGSPFAVNNDNTVISFNYYEEFDGPALSVLITDEWTGDVDTTVWTDVTPEGLDGSTSAAWTTVATDPLPFQAAEIVMVFRYQATGNEAGQGKRIGVDHVCVKQVECGFDFEGEDDTIIDGTLDSWTVINQKSNRTWEYDTYGDSTGAFNNNYESADGGLLGGVDADDWLIGSPFAVSDDSTIVSFSYYEEFDGPALSVLITDDWTGDVDSTEWTDVTPEDLDGSTSAAWIRASTAPLPIQGDLVVAFRYQATGNAAGEGKRIGVDFVCVNQYVCGYDFLGEVDAVIGDTLDSWDAVNLKSDREWVFDIRGGDHGAFNNNYDAADGGQLGGVDGDDWLVGSPFAVSDNSTVVSFSYYEKYDDTVEKALAVLITDNWTGDVATTEWTDVTPAGLDGSTTDGVWIPVETDALPIQGENIVMAFRYLASGNGVGEAKRVGFNLVCVNAGEGDESVDSPDGAETFSLMFAAVIGFVTVFAL